MERHNRSTVTARQRVEPLLGKRKTGLILITRANTQTEAQGDGAALWMCVWAVTKRETGKNVGQGPKYHLLGTNRAGNEQVLKKVKCFSLMLYHRLRISACTAKKVKEKMYYKLPKKRAFRGNGWLPTAFAATYRLNILSGSQKSFIDHLFYFYLLGAHPFETIGCVIRKKARRAASRAATTTQSNVSP